MNKKKKLIFVLLILVAIIGITAGVTYAFLSYTKEGVKENRITTGAITFHYNEDSFQGLSLQNALPMSDGNGQSQSSYFEFTITSNNGSEVNIPYMITARKVSNQADEIDNQYVKIRLTKVTTENNIDSENQVLLDTYDTLSSVIKNNHTEEVLWTDSVLAGNTNYSQTYRLRLWLADTLDFSPLKDDQGNYIEDNNGDYVYPHNDKEFSIKVNVYSGNQTTTPAQQQQAPVNSINVANVEANETENPNYDYQVSVPSDTTSTTIEVETADPYANVKIERIADPTESTGYNYEKPRIERMSINKTVTLQNGDNYFRVTIIPTVGNQIQYILKVKVEKPAGLYNDNDELVKSWSQLLSDGDIEVTNGALKGKNSSSINGKLVIDSSVTSLANYAFYQYTSLTAVEMPDSIMSIGSYSFSGCTNLVSVVLSSNVTILPSGLFYGANKLANVALPNNLVEIGSSCFYQTASLTSITLPSSLQTIGDSAFTQSGLTGTLTIPSSVNRIGAMCFRHCNNLTDIAFEDTNGWSVDVTNSKNNRDAQVNGPAGNGAPVWSKTN